LKFAEEIIHPDGWMKILPLQEHREQQFYLQLQSHLHMGEASCLALASARKMILATDDLAARKMARKHNVLLTGTIGILVRMVKGRVIQLEAANQLLSTMVAFEYHSPVQRLDDFVK
jgi:predicted nucleic acid-binding protein